MLTARLHRILSLEKIFSEVSRNKPKCFQMTNIVLYIHQLFQNTYELIFHQS